MQHPEKLSFKSEREIRPQTKNACENSLPVERTERSIDFLHAEGNYIGQKHGFIFKKEKYKRKNK